MEKSDCPVCFDNLENEVITCTQCHREICLDCFSRLVKVKCPLCRKYYNDDYKSDDEDDFPQSPTLTRQNAIRFDIDTWTFILTASIQY